jgi:hypothetical protein
LNPTILSGHLYCPSGLLDDADQHLVAAYVRGNVPEIAWTNHLLGVAQIVKLSEHELARFTVPHNFA